MRSTERHPPLPLDQAAVLVGEWWLPDDPESAASGRLTYDPESGLELETVGGGWARVGEPFPFIHGVTVEGRAVTLTDTFVTNWSLNMPGGIRAELKPGRAFVGLHAASDADLRFWDLGVRATGVETWAATSGLSVDSIFPSSGIKVETPSPVDLARVRGKLISVRFQIVGQVSPDRFQPTTASVEQQTRIEVSAKRRTHVDELGALLDHARAFIAVSTGRDGELLEMSGTTTVDAHEFRGPTTRRVRSTQQIWILFTRQARAATEPRARDVLVSMLQATESLSKVFARWMRLEEKVSTSTVLYRSVLSPHGLPFEFRLLALFASADALHSRNFLPTPPPRRPLRPAEVLSDLVAQLPAATMRFIPPHFVQTAVDARNYLTHWNPQRQHHKPSEDQLVALVFAMQTLIELNLLLRAGVRKRDAASIAANNQRMVWQIQAGFLSL